MIKPKIKGGFNYPLPTHNDFCKRCFAYNNGCKSNGKNYSDKNCRA